VCGRPVSAAKNSVPGSSVGDRFDLCMGSWQFGPDGLHHPVFPNRANGRRSRRGRFCGDLAAYFQRFRSLPTITVSPVDSWPPVSASKNSVPGALDFGTELTSRPSGIVCRDASFEQRPNLLRIQSEGFELSAPFRGSVAEPLDTDAARQATFDRGFDTRARAASPC
jgi:hypothetical protein